jgi:AraC-like DNA-binding protein
LTDRVVPLAEVGLRWLEPTRLAGVADLERAACALEQQLLDRSRSIASPDPLVTHAVTTLLGPSSPSVERLSRALGCSRQHLRRTFDHHVGVGPKLFARVARMQRAVDALQRTHGRGIAAVAVALGYSDQAHLCRDLRDLAGVTPGAARGSAGSIFTIRSLVSAADPEDEQAHAEPRRLEHRAMPAVLGRSPRI